MAVEHTTATVPGLERWHGARLSWAVLALIACFGVALAGSMSALAARAEAPAADAAGSMNAPSSGKARAALPR